MRSSHAPTLKITGDFRDVSYAPSLIAEVKQLNAIYGNIVLEVARDTNRSGNAFAHTSADKIIHVVRDARQQQGEFTHNVGFSGDTTTIGRAIGSHEFAHALTDGLGWLPQYAQSWDDFKKDDRRNGFKVAESKVRYERYLKRREDALNKRADKPKQAMLQQLADLDKKYQAQINEDHKIIGVEKSQNGK